MAIRTVVSLIVICGTLTFLSQHGASIPLRVAQAENSPQLQLFQGDGRNWVLRARLRYKIEKTGQIIYVPTGFVTDFASVPWAARSFVPSHGNHSVPAIVHDYLYWDQKCSRLEADLIMFAAMEEYESSWFAKHAVWSALRWGGGDAWSINIEDRKKELIRVIPPKYVDIPPNAIWSEYRQELFDKGVRETRETSGNVGAPLYCKL
jgi:hypothetical protein